MRKVLLLACLGYCTDHTRAFSH